MWVLYYIACPIKYRVIRQRCGNFGGKVGMLFATFCHIALPTRTTVVLLTSEFIPSFPPRLPPFFLPTKWQVKNLFFSHCSGNFFASFSSDWIELDWIKLPEWKTLNLQWLKQPPMTILYLQMNYGKVLFPILQKR